MNISGDQYHAFEPTFKLTGPCSYTHPPEFPLNIEKPVVIEEQEGMAHRFKSLEHAMRNFQGLGGYKSVSYKDL